MIVKLEETDGREVDSYSEDWRHYCEARAVLAMRGLDTRRRYLDGWFDYETKPQHRGVLQNRGKAECDRLKATMRIIWGNRQAK